MGSDRAQDVAVLGQNGYYGSMLDAIIVSQNLAKGATWHPLHDPAFVANPMLSKTLLTACDHFLVSIDLSLPIAPPLA